MCELRLGNSNTVKAKLNLRSLRVHNGIFFGYLNVGYEANKIKACFWNDSFLNFNEDKKP